MKIAVHGMSTGPEAQACISDILLLLNTYASTALISKAYLGALNEKAFLQARWKPFLRGMIFLILILF